jgi:hypothetical protein
MVSRYVYCELIGAELQKIGFRTHKELAQKYRPCGRCALP